jgi:hypothetical protein
MISVLGFLDFFQFDLGGWCEAFSFGVDVGERIAGVWR